MSRLFVLLIAIPFGAAGASSVAGTDSQLDQAEAAVDPILKAETEFRQPLDRRALLQKVLEQNPDAAAARWQAGYIRAGKDWRPFEETIDSFQDDALRDEYHTLRRAAGHHTDDQVRLANWCKANGLPEQERAHLTAALAFSGGRDLPQLRARLGHRFVSGRWMTREEITDVERSSNEMLRSTRIWGHRLQSIAERLAGSRRQRESAIAELKSIDDPAALRAVELVLAGAGETAALQAVALFARFDCYESTLGLARQAAFSPWPSVRSAAAEILKFRRWDDFVPTLLAAMYRPAESRFQILIGGRGELYYAYLCVREMADHVQIARYGLRNFLNVSSRLPSNAGGPREAPLNRRRADSIRFIEDDIHRRNALVARHNDETEALNSRLGEVLAKATGQKTSSDPQDWWNWWVHFRDVQPREKRIVIVNEEDQLGPPPPPPISCLASGTPVWTDRGAIPIDQIEIGDRVLAKDVETGELAYKPVVLTTVRDATSLVRISIAGEELRITAGHPIWASGTGWTRARDLSPAHPLHTVTGTAVVDSVESVDSGTVYNLVVADFHTYFFGDSMFLSHDTTIPKLTNVVVPGLPPEHSHSE